MKSDIRNWIILIAEESSHEAFEKLYLYFSPGMRAYAATLAGDQEVALDLVQDLFAGIWANRRNLTSIDNIATYLYCSLKNNAVHYLKTRKRGVTFFEEQSDLVTLECSNPELDAIARENRRLLEAAINSLPHKCRLIFRLIKEDGLKYKDVAGLLDVSVKTVEAHMTLAYSRIVECLETILPHHTRSYSSKRKSGS
jgi:RNA polymerase sigma-70 factor (ECF subfamily)